MENTLFKLSSNEYNSLLSLLNTFGHIFLLTMTQYKSCWKGTQTWEIPVSWCGVTPFKAEIYWTEVVQQTFEVHNMSYSGGGEALKGKSAPLKFPDIRIFMVGNDRCSSTYSFVVVTMVYTQNISDQSISFSLTESIFTDIQEWV